jgi:hypothetical protein
MKAGDQRDDALRQQQTDRNRQRDFDRKLAEKDLRHFAPRKAEHAQAGKLPGALLQRDPSAVVNHADGDDHRESREDAGADENDTADLVQERGQRIGFHRHRLDDGKLLESLRQCRECRRLDEQRRGRNDRAFAGEPVERIDLHIGRHPNHLVDECADRQVDLAALALHDFDGHDVAGGDLHPLGQPAGEGNATGRHVDGTQRGIVRATQCAVEGKADHRRQVAQMSRA